VYRLSDVDVISELNSEFLLSAIQKNGGGVSGALAGKHGISPKKTLNLVHVGWWLNDICSAFQCESGVFLTVIAD
jgi:hypothetical protein